MKFLVKSKKGIVTFVKNKETGVIERKRVGSGEVADLSEEQCKFYAAKGEVIPEEKPAKK